MSTKIYDGCRIHVSTLLEYSKFVQDIKHKIKPVIKRIVLEQAVLRAARLVDRIHLEGESPNCRYFENFIGYGLDKYEKDIKEDKSGYTKYHSGEVSIMMFSENGKTSVLAIPFFGHPDSMAIFKNHDLVEEYGLQIVR